MLQYPQEEPDFAVALSTSLVLFGFDGNDLQVLLAKSKRAPYAGALFLPSRYLNENDELMLSARKMFKQLFGYEDPTMIEQLQAFGKVFRHPGGRVINVAHYAFVIRAEGSSMSLIMPWCEKVTFRHPIGMRMTCSGCHLHKFQTSHSTTTKLCITRRSG